MMVVVFQLRQMPAVAAASSVVGAGRNLDEGVGNRLWKTGRHTDNSHRGGGPTPTRRGAGRQVVQLVNRDGVDDQPEAAGAPAGTPTKSQRWATTNSATTKDRICKKEHKNNNNHFVILLWRHWYKLRSFWDDFIKASVMNWWLFFSGKTKHKKKQRSRSIASGIFSVWLNGWNPKTAGRVSSGPTGASWGCLWNISSSVCVQINVSLTFSNSENLTCESGYPRKNGNQVKSYRIFRIRSDMRSGGLVVDSRMKK